MFGIAIISKKKLEELKQSAYYSGFQAARSVGYLDPTPPSYGRVEHCGPYAASSCGVTRDNTHAANTAVQEAQAEMKQAVVNKKHRRTRKASYNDPHIRLIFSGVLIEEFIFKHIGKLTTEQIVKKIIQDEGTHIRGYRNPIKVTERTVEDIMGRRLVWDEDTNIFLNVYSRNRK